MDVLLLIGSDRPKEAGDRLAHEGVNDIRSWISWPHGSIRVLHIDQSTAPRDIDAGLPSGGILINCMSDPDVNPRTLATVRTLISNFNYPVINHPDAVERTRRDRISELLRDVPGLLVPQTLRLSSNELARLTAEMIQFPVIIREAGAHGGFDLLKVDSPSELSDAAQQFSQAEAVYVTEFVNFVSADGYYRKIRLFVVGGEVVPRHHMVSQSWNVHMRSRTEIMLPSPELRAEEEEFFRSMPSVIGERAVAGLVEAVRRVGLDYFGIDCALMSDGRLVVFEANATMNVLPLSSQPEFAYLKAPVVEIVKSFNTLIQSRIPQSPVVSHVDALQS